MSLWTDIKHFKSSFISRTSSSSKSPCLFCSCFRLSLVWVSNDILKQFNSSGGFRSGPTGPIFLDVIKLSGKLPKHGIGVPVQEILDPLLKSSEAVIRPRLRQMSLPGSWRLLPGRWKTCSDRVYSSPRRPHCGCRPRAVHPRPGPGPRSTWGRDSGIPRRALRSPRR